MASSRLSPAAQIVWDAAWQLSPVNCESHEDCRRQQIAAALRAAADQMSAHHSKTFLYSIADYWKLQSIADELEDNNAQ